MLRKTLTILSLIGLLLSVGLWGMSYFTVLLIHPPARFGIAASAGSSEIRFYDSPQFDAHDVDAFATREGLSCLVFGGGAVAWEGFRDWSTDFWAFYLESFPEFLLVGFPLWVPCVVFAALPCYSVFPHHRRRKRKKLGLCLKCGYDLRASKDRCPECGSTI